MTWARWIWARLLFTIALNTELVRGAEQRRRILVLARGALRAIPPSHNGPVSTDIRDNLMAVIVRVYDSYPPIIQRHIASYVHSIRTSHNTVYSLDKFIESTLADAVDDLDVPDLWYLFFYQLSVVLWGRR